MISGLGQINTHLDAFAPTECNATTCFTPALDAEYTRVNLEHNRALICAACILGTLVAAFRGFQQFYIHPVHAIQFLDLVLVVGSMTVLALVACSSAFERLYLPLARIIIPCRNVIIAAEAAYSAAIGQLELLMAVPVIVIAPFFFLGLPLREALISGVVTFVVFIVSAVVFHAPVAVVWQAVAFIFASLLACGIACWQVDRRSRAVFLETRRIAELAQHDSLTWTKNRRVFDAELMRLWSLALAERGALTVMLIDVDHFKIYNDRHGHQAGDRALCRVAQMLQQHVEPLGGMVARYGGEEFAVLLHKVDSKHARDIAERMRQAIQDMKFTEGTVAVVGIAVSIGVAAIKPDGKRDPYGAVQLADQALYLAKIKGRNRVELMSDAEYQMLVTGAFVRQASEQAARTVQLAL
jgi:diguanylate cyclase (GGDEF)-like protein